MVLGSVNPKSWFLVWKVRHVCKALDLQAKHVIERLDKGTVSSGPLPTAGGIQQANFINEDGLYDVILDSRKPEAKKFRKWITSDVLPTLRKTDTYSIRQAKDMYPLEAVTQVTTIAAQIQSSFAVRKGIALAQAINIVEPVEATVD